MNDPCVLAVDAGGTALKSSLASPDGTLIEGTFHEVPLDSQGPAQGIAAAFRALCRDMRQKAQSCRLNIVKAGVCIPGPFLYTEGVSHMTHKYQSVYGVPMRPWFQEVLGPVPVHFLHDSSAFLQGAVCPEDRLQHRRICGVILGTGLGFASMVDRTLLLNDQGGPGISIFRRPYRDGTAEDYASRRAVEAQYRALTHRAEIPTVKDIADLARSGDRDARACFQTLGQSLGEILQPVIRENGFTLLLLGGAIAKSADLFLPQLRSSVALPSLTVRPASHIDAAPLIGAARSS